MYVTFFYLLSRTGQYVDQALKCAIYLRIRMYKKPMPQEPVIVARGRQRGRQGVAIGNPEDRRGEPIPANPTRRNEDSRLDVDG